MWWIAPAVIAAIAVIALFLPVKLRIWASDEIFAEWRVLFFRKMLYPAPPKKKKKGAKKKKEQPEKAKKPKETTAENVVSMIRSVTKALSTLWDKLRRRVKIKLIRLTVVIATDEAAKAALIYGAAANACDALLDALRRYLKFTEKDGAVSVSVDFSKEKTEFDFDIELSLSLMGMISVLLPALNKYLNSNKK